MVRRTASDTQEKKVLVDIDAYGWHCVNILAEEGLPGFSFSVGNYHSTKHPEFIIFGLRPDVAHQILTLAIAGLKDGTIVDLSAPTDELLNGNSCLFVKVPEAHYREHVGFGRWYYEGNSFPLYQIVWPSREGNFPWHAGAREAFRAAQPVLGLPHGT